MKRIQMSNKRYGSLIVLSFAGNGKNGADWKCKCDCGNTKIIQGYLLRRGSIKTCGCGIGIKNDFRKKKFGNLLVLRKIGIHKSRNIIWEAICSCGNVINIMSKNLLSGKTKSCGCLRKIERGEANFNKLYKGYSDSAKTRGVSFELTKKQFKIITKNDCHYCGVEPRQIKSRKFSNGNYLFNGIDRKDNTLGYTISNSLPCCFVCNRAKGNMLYGDFILWIKAITKR